MPGNFFESVGLAGFAALVLDDRYALHYVGDGNDVACYGDVDGRCSCPVSGSFDQSIVFESVDYDLESRLGLL